MRAEKTLYNKDGGDVSKNVPDVNFFGDADTFRLICKASSEEEGWMKSTKVMEIKGVGCVVQVTTQQQNENGSYSLAEAITFVPMVKIVEVKARSSYADGHEEVISRQIVKMKPHNKPDIDEMQRFSTEYRRWRHGGTGSIISLRPTEDPGGRWLMLNEETYQKLRNDKSNLIDDEDL